MPNQVDRDFSGATAWSDVDLNNYDEDGALDIEGDADQYCTCPVLSMPTTIGTRYDLFFDVESLAETWTFQDFTGAQALGIVKSNGLQQHIDWIAETTGGLRIVAVANNAGATFDNFSLKTKDQSDAKTGITSGVWNWITNGKALGAKISFTITGAKTIKYLIYKYLNRGTR